MAALRKGEYKKYFNAISICTNFMCLKNLFIEKKVTGFPAKSLEASKAENSNGLIIKLI